MILGAMTISPVPRLWKYIKLKVGMAKSLAKSWTMKEKKIFSTSVKNVEKSSGLEANFKFTC